MEPLFINVTKYTTKNYKEFLQFHDKKFSFSYNFYTIIMSLLLFYCIILNIIQKKWILLLFFILVFVLFLWLRLYLPLSKSKKSYINLKDKKQPQQFEFRFYKHFFVLNQTRFYYFNLYKVFETSDYFYLYVNEDSSALVSKKGFKNEKTPEEFSEFIKKKCMLKYSRQK